MIKLKDILPKNILMEYTPGGKMNPFSSGMSVLNLLNAQEYKLDRILVDAIFDLNETGEIDDFIDNTHKLVIGSFDSFDVILSENVGYNDNTYILIDFDAGSIDDLFVGVIQTYRRNIWKKRVETMLDISGVDPEDVYGSKIVQKHIGKGIGSKFYDTVLKHAKVLISDSHLYEDSVKLWAYHMSKKTFFGMIMYDRDVNEYQNILPLNAKTAADPGIFEFAKRFIAVDDSISIPPYLRKLKDRFSSINFLTELAVFRTTMGVGVKRIDVSKSGDFFKNGDTLINVIEDELTSFEDLFDLMADGNGAQSTGMMKNFQEKMPKSLENTKAVLILMGDAELMVTETSSGLSVTLL